MSKADAFILEHFPGALPTEASRLSGDIFNEEFFPDMTEEQLNNIPEGNPRCDRSVLPTFKET
jgi:hypothetical protein